MPQSDMLLEDLQDRTKTELQEIAGNLLAECHGHRFDAHKQAGEILKLKAQIAQLQSGAPGVVRIIPIYFRKEANGTLRSIPAWEYENFREDARFTQAFVLDDAHCPAGHIAVKVGWEDVNEWAYLPADANIVDAVLLDLSFMEQGHSKEDDVIKLAWDAVYLHSVLGYGADVTGIAE